ncbi:hypothetical protein GJ496_004603 [Pomphorhynchus laevis]|nr:hypothetical protein GJ496_004603 [Pomphorhynchus laevis]
MCLSMTLGGGVIGSSIISSIILYGILRIYILSNISASGVGCLLVHRGVTEGASGNLIACLRNFPLRLALYMSLLDSP